MSKLTVVGAGVVGLTVSLEILQNLANIDLTILSTHLPGDFQIQQRSPTGQIYTSPLAGANWSSFASLEDKFVQNIDRIGWNKFKELAENHPECGIIKNRQTNYVTKEYFERHGVKIPWYGFDAKHGGMAEQMNFEVTLPNDVKPPKNIHYKIGDVANWGFFYQFDGYVINVSQYTNWLMLEILKYPNCKVIRKTVQSLSEISGNVVNCTGLSASLLPECNNDGIYPVKGVLYILENFGLTNLTSVSFIDDKHKQDGLYLMPRNNGELVVGGCYIPINDIEEVEFKVPHGFKERLWRRLKTYLPQYDWDNAKLVREQIGFRPFRKGGYRIEREGNIIHCYGIGGAGFQSSYGCAEKVLGLISLKSKL